MKQTFAASCNFMLIIWTFELSELYRRALQHDEERPAVYIQGKGRLSAKCCDYISNV